jgi:hypothetical protein
VWHAALSGFLIISIFFGIVNVMCLVIPGADFLLVLGSLEGLS